MSKNFNLSPIAKKKKRNFFDANFLSKPGYLQTVFTQVVCYLS